METQEISLSPSLSLALTLTRLNQTALNRHCRGINWVAMATHTEYRLQFGKVIGINEEYEFLGALLWITL